MAFPIQELIWDDWNIEHIARHHVVPSEIEDVCEANPFVLRARGKDKKAFYGQTAAGRYLCIIMADRQQGRFYPITARDMTDTERRLYRSRRRG